MSRTYTFADMAARKNLSFEERVILCTDSSRIDDAIQYYYTVHDPDLWEDARKTLRDASIEKKRNIALVLFAECVNRDTISYVTTGKKTSTSIQMMMKI
jgi:hypothetical protein